MQSVHLSGSWCGIYGDSEDNSTPEGTSDWTDCSPTQVAWKLRLIADWLDSHANDSVVLYYNQ